MFKKLLFLFSACLFLFACKKSNIVQPTTTNGVSIYTFDNSQSLVWRSYVSETNTWNTSQNGNVLGTFSKWSSYLSFKSGTNGNIYLVDNTGNLYWHNHTGYKIGDKTWATSEPVLVGNGFSQFQKLFSGGEGVIFALKGGELYWYNHTGYNDGKVTWHDGQGKKIGTGWDQYNDLIATDNGIIYALKGTSLYWYQYLSKTGTVEWKSTQPTLVASNFDFKNIISGGKGIIFAIDTQNRIWYFNHKGYLDGSSTWDNNGNGIKIAEGWIFSKAL